MSYLYLLFSSCCSLALVHLLKLAEVKNLRTVNTLTVNYLVAGFTALILGFSDTAEQSSAEWAGFMLLIFCLAAGALFIGNFFVYSKSVHSNGVGVSITAMRLSLIIPVIVSISLYDEVLAPIKFMGVLMVFGALMLLIPRKTTTRFGKINASWLLIIVFALSGLADTSIKVYNEEFSTTLNELWFMSLVFAGAFIIGLIACLLNNKKKPIVTRHEFLMGSLIGIPNLYSSIFLIYALEGISGSVAFPLVNTLNVLGGTLLGLARWNDRISKWQWLGIAISIAAIILLV